MESISVVADGLGRGECVIAKQKKEGVWGHKGTALYPDCAGGYMDPYECYNP